MNKFDGLSLEEGFVLSQKDAIEFLDDTAQQQTKMVMNGETDSECLDAIMQDLYEMKRDIITHDSEYIKFFECPMSASNINIVEMVEKGE